VFYDGEVGRPQYREVQCKSALNKVRGMPFRWSLNPYRGCEHECGYCYARASHTFLGLNAGEDFGAQLFVKANVAQVLRGELGRRSWRRETVALGTATDPYQPAEGRYRLSRACLEALGEFSTPASVTTKGTLVVRDVDVLQHLAARAGVGVSVSLFTLDVAVWRALEPGAPPPRQRLAALRRLAGAGVPCGLALAPVLPGLTDSPAALDELVRAAGDHGAQWLWAGTVHLEPVVRDWFYGRLAGHFPAIVPAYTRVFGGAGEAGGARYAPPRYARALHQRVSEAQVRYGLAGWRRPAPHGSPPGAAAAPGADLAGAAGLDVVPAAGPRQRSLPG
jgi:DNA repair photolyase